MNLQKLILSTFLLGVWFHSLAQDIPPPSENTTPKTFQMTELAGKAKIIGQITDSIKRENIEFATVVLQAQEADSLKTIDGTTTDSEGKFTLEKIPEGKYLLIVSFIAYQKDSTWVEVPRKKKTIDLGVIYLQASTDALDEVTVEGQKELVEVKFDRIVYNAEADPSNAGGNAADVLQKVPMLSVDLEGKPKLKGKANIRVLINNKPSTIIASKVEDALRQIPADNIKSVEVITSPSSKYDAEGTGGIINIITKEKNLKGFAGSISAGAGNRRMYGYNSLNFRRKKFGISFNANASSHFAPDESNNERTSLGTETTFLEQKSKGNYGSTYLGYGLNFDYDFTDKTYISTGFRMGDNSNDSHSDLSSITQNEDAVILEQFWRDINNEGNGNNFSWNMDFVKGFKKEGQELSVMTLYTQNYRNSEYHLDQRNTNQIIDYIEQNQNKNTTQEATAKIDYMQNIAEKINFEVGVKNIFRNIGSDFRFEEFDFAQNQFVELPTRSNDFEYIQNILSSYTSLRYKTKSEFTFRVGLRYERTNVDANFRSTDTRFAQEYDNFLPNILISKMFKMKHQVSLSYSRRLYRPSIYYLNPFVNYSDVKNISFGNPNLDPELSDNINLSYNVFWGGNSINISTYFNTMDNAITSIRNIDEQGVVSTTYGNIAQNKSIGFSIYAMSTIAKIWRISGNINASYDIFNDPSNNISNENWSTHFFGNTSVDILKGLSISLWGYGSLPSPSLQGSDNGYLSYSLNIRKKLFKDKGSLSVGATNFFNPVVNFGSETVTPTFRDKFDSFYFSGAYNISFSYRFGKMEFKQRSRRGGIQNDDMKSSGGNGK